MLIKKIKIQDVLDFYLTIGIPLVYLINLILIMQSNTVLLPIPMRLIGLGLTISGIVIWIISYCNLGKSFGVLPKVQERTTNGIYSYLKHPMYLGITATFLGLSIALQSRPGVSMTILVLIPLLKFRAHLEEKKLK